VSHIICFFLGVFAGGAIMALFGSDTQKTAERRVKQAEAKACEWERRHDEVVGALAEIKARAMDSSGGPKAPEVIL